jgi:hypothetical protein
MKSRAVRHAGGGEPHPALHFECRNDRFDHAAATEPEILSECQDRRQRG